MPLQIFSVLVLAMVSAVVSYDLLITGINNNKILMLTIVLLFLIPSVVYVLPASSTQSGKLLTFIYSLENTAAYAFLIVLFWALTMLSESSLLSIALSVALSLILIWATWDPRWRPLQTVIRSFCVLFAMVIATFALMRRQKNGIWMVLALMALAFGLKPQLISSVDPFESHNLLKAIAIFFTGRAISAGNRALFGKIPR